MVKLTRHFLIALLLVPLLSYAQLLDSVDVTRTDGATLLTIRFATTVQYIRHAPADEGKFMRLYFRVTDTQFVERDIVESLRTPKSDLLPTVALSYPESLSMVPKAMLLTFSKVTRFKVESGEDRRSIRIYLPLPGEKEPRVAPAATASPKVSSEPPETNARAGQIAASSPDAPEKAELASALTVEQVEARTREFLREAREAFEAKDYLRASGRLYRILGMPRSDQTEAAQAMIGRVRDAAGEYSKAKAEYELFLKLYPKSAEAPAIKARLAVLPTVDVRPKARPRARTDEPAVWQFYGGISSNFYTGKSSYDGGPMLTDQKSIVSSLNMTARLRDGATDTRFVYRDTHNRNQLSPVRSYNRVYSAYAERTDRDAGYFVRAGRQNPNGSGVMERFDGLTANYSFNEDWRVGGVKGTAVEFTAPYKKTFHGANVEFSAQAGRPGVNAYFIEQDVDGYLSRRAVGAEARYFDGAFNSFGVVDYDMLYKEVNMVMLQGNAMDTQGNNYYVSLDRRLTPMLGLTTGMSLLGQSSVADVINLVGMEDARRLIAKGSPMSTMYGMGMTHPIGEKWQVGVDYRSSFIGGANAALQLSQICDLSTVNEANGICTAPNGSTVFLSNMCTTWSLADNTCLSTQQASGTTNSYTFQAIGTNLFKTNAVGVANLSLTKGPTYTGQNMSVSYIYPIGDNWRLESNMRYYTQKSDTGEVSDRTSPSIKLAYQWRNQMYLESEVGRDVGKTTSGDTTTTSRRDYLYMGMRWDFR